MKIIIVLGIKYDSNLLDNDIVENILKKMINTKEIVFSAMCKAEIQMYLQCLVALMKLSSFTKYNLSLTILDNKNVQNLVGMALKYGTKGKKWIKISIELNKNLILINFTNRTENDGTGAAQKCQIFFTGYNFRGIDKTFYCERISVTKQFFFLLIFQILCDEIFDANVSFESYGKHCNIRQNKITEDSFHRVFLTIQKACDENKLNRIHVTDFINLYQCRIDILNRDIEILNDKLHGMTNELTTIQHARISSERNLMRSMDLGNTLMKSNEV